MPGFDVLPTSIEMQENPFTRPTRAPNVRQMKNWLLMLYGPTHKRELLEMVKAVDTTQEKEGAVKRMAKMVQAATNVTQIEEFFVKSGDGLRDDVIYYNNDIPCATRCCAPNFPWWRKRLYYCCFCRLCGRGATRALFYIVLATLFAMVFGALVTAFVQHEKGEMCGVIAHDKDVLFDCSALIITNITSASYGALTYNSDGVFDRQCSDGPKGVACNVAGLREMLMTKCMGKSRCRMNVAAAVEEAMPGADCAAAAKAGDLRLWASVQCSTWDGHHGCVQNVNCDVQMLEPKTDVVLNQLFAKFKDLDPFTVMKRVTSVFALLFMYLLQGRARNVKWTSRHLVYRTSTWHKTKRKVDCGACGEHHVGLPRDCQWCPCSNNHMETIDAVHIRNVTMIQDPFQYRCGVGDVHVHVHARGTRKGHRRSKVARDDRDCLSRLGCKKADLATDTLVIEDVANVHDFYDFLNYKLEEDAGAGFISDYQPETVQQQPQAVPGGGVSSSMHVN